MLTAAQMDHHIRVPYDLRGVSQSSIAMKAALKICDEMNTDDKIVMQPGLIYTRCKARVAETLGWITA
jgi:hypothetical protein